MKISNQFFFKPPKSAEQSRVGEGGGGVTGKAGPIIPHKEGQLTRVGEFSLKYEGRSP